MRAAAVQVEEVRMVLRMTPIFLLTILYWTIYSQMASVRVPAPRSPYDGKPASRTALLKATE